MRIWPLFSRRRRDQELDEEIRAHLAMATRDRIERGEEAESAELAARREFGNRTLIQETTREMWGWDLLGTLWQDARYALRGMWRSPGFTAAAVLSLALGIGANTAIFSLMNTVMLRMLPVREPQQLVELLSRYPGEPRANGFSWKVYEHFRDHNHVFSVLTGAAVDARTRVRTEGSEPEIVTGEYVAGDYFPALGLKPAIGRLIGPADDPTSGTGAVAVLSWSYWKARFNQDPAILGKRIVVQDAPMTIIGVAPRAFFGLQVGFRTEVWLPHARSAQMGLYLVGRLKPGVPIEQARAEMRVLDQWRVQEVVKASKDPLLRQLKIEVEPAGAGLSRVRDRYAKPLIVLMAVVGLLLLIACINIANMLLARGAGRRREMAVRIGLGASRGRLVRQVLTESVLLSLAGTLAGVVLAYFGTGALVRIISSGREHERINLEVQPDLHVLLFAAGIAVLTGLLFGLAPALSACRSAPASALRETVRAGETRLRGLFGRGLVAAQVALSVLLLSAAGLFIGHMSNLRNQGLGFRRDHVLLVALDTQRGGYQRAELSRRSQEMLARLEAIPGVRSATVCGATPIQGAGASRFVTAEGYQERLEDRRYVSLNWVGPKYFETLGTPLLAGRDFNPFEHQNRVRVAIINQAMARHYFAGRNPLGRHITMDGDDKPVEVVGVAGDAKYTELRDAPPPTMYLNIFQAGQWFSQYAVRTSVDPVSVTAEVRHALGDILKTVPIERVITLAEQVDGAIVPERLMATLSGFFGALGAVLAGIGLYGLLAYTVARRINEIGIRMALGATAGDVTRMVLGDALTMVTAGVVLGVPMAIWGRSLAARLIQDLTIQTPAPLALGAAAIIAVALAASYVPARRAARVDPMEALRHE